MSKTVDEIFDAIKTTLTTYSDSLEVSERFTVYPDYFRRSPPKEPGTYVFLYLDKVTPTTKGATRRNFQFTVTYILDCIAVAKGQRVESSYTEADQIAGDKLRKLIPKVWEALFNKDGTDLGFAIGQIGNRPFPLIQAFPGEALEVETPYVGLRMTLDIDSNFTPSGVEGTPIDKIVVSMPNNAGAEVIPDAGSST